MTRAFGTPWKAAKPDTGPRVWSDCWICNNERFVIGTEKRLADGIEYDPAATPCPSCNPNPPRLQW